MKTLAFAIVAALALVVVASACGEADATTSVAASPVPGATAELDVMEAVFRYQANHNASGWQQDVGAYYLAVGGAVLTGTAMSDPSPALMQRMTGNTPPYRLFSESTGTDLGGVKDKQTGERGLIFYIESVTLHGKDSASVEGGYYEGGLSSSGNTYTLTHDASGWHVTGDVMHWIS